MLLLSVEEDAVFWQRYMHQVVEIATKAALTATPESSAQHQPFHYNQQRQRRNDSEGDVESEGAGAPTAPLRNYKEVASLLLAKAEEKVGPVQFLGIISSVQRNLQRRKAGRKRERAAEAILSPQEFAIKKVMAIMDMIAELGFINVCMYLISPDGTNRFEGRTKETKE